MEHPGEQAVTWIEALHESIAQSHPSGTKPLLDSSDLERAEFEAVRDCLALLERARKSQPSTAESPVRVGRFEIVREVGRGGFGVVFAAIDPAVGRKVALKVPRPEVLVDPVARARFLREARAAGGLAHPNLVAVYEVGEDPPFCYITSAFCDGPNLAQWLEARDKLPSARESANLVRALALGVAHAHSRGVLHRDIKPSNVLLEPASDELIPRLTDFGLAKLVELADEHTRSGVLVGTPAYMAPEQAEGRQRDIGPATDVYALGVILYELLAGQPPYRGESDVQTLQLVARGEPQAPSRHRFGIPRDLEAIVLRCLERDPNRRYASAGFLADDLCRFLSGEPTLARPAHLVVRVAKWTRRRPAAAMLTFVMASAALVLSVGGWMYSARLKTAIARVEAAEHGHRRTLYVANLDRARRAINMGQDGLARELLARWKPQSGEPDLREFSWHYAWRQLHDEVASLAGHEGDVFSVRYSPDGRLLASAGQDGTARLWDAASGECLRTLAGHSGDVNSIAFSPDGALLATVDAAGAIRIWQVASGKRVRTLSAHNGQAFGVAFSPGGELLTSCGEDKLALLWNTSTWNLEAKLEAHTSLVGGVSFSPDGKLLATAGDDNLVILWDLASRKAIRRLSHAGPVGSVKFDHSGQRFLAAVRSERMASLWQVTDRRLGQTPRFSEVVHAVGFERSDKRFAVATKDGTVELFDTGTLNSVHRFRGHTSRVWSLDFAPDGKSLVTAGAEGAIKIWRLPIDYARPVGFPLRVESLSVGAGGDVVASGDGQGNVEIVDLSTRRALLTIPIERQVVGDFDGDGVQDPGSYHGGNWHMQLSSLNGKTHTQSFGTSRDVPVVGDFDGDGRDEMSVFRSPGTWFLYLDGEVPVSSFGPDRVSQEWSRVVPLLGRWAGATDRKSLAVFDIPTRHWIFWVHVGKRTARIDTTCDDQNAVPVGGDWPGLGREALGLYGSAGLWTEPFRSPSLQAAIAKAKNDPLWRDSRQTVLTPTKRSELDPQLLDAAVDRNRIDGFETTVQTVALSPAGDRVAMCLANDYRVRVFDSSTGRKVGQVRLESSFVSHAAYTPDARFLTIGTRDGELQFYDAQNLTPSGSLAAHQKLERLAYSADGQVLATLGDGDQVKIWDRDRRLVRALSHDGDVLDGIAISIDGKLLAAVGNGRLVYLWDVETGIRLAAMPGHDRTIHAVAISPDKRTLATGGDDGLVKLWDVSTRQEIYTLVDPGDVVRSITFSADGRDLIAGSYMNAQMRTLHIWSMRPTETRPVVSARQATRRQPQAE